MSARRLELMAAGIGGALAVIGLAVFFEKVIRRG